MPQPKRTTTVGTVCHLISRFIDKEWFIASEEERGMYMRFLDQALTRTGCSCLAFAVMSSHIHFLIVVAETPFAEWLRSVHSRFATWINERRRSTPRIGGIFVKGPKEYVVDPRDVAKVIAYIHNNPVRAGVVRSARDSSWTSHRAYLGAEDVPKWLDIAGGFERMEFSDPHDFDCFVDDSRARRGVYPKRRRRGPAKRAVRGDVDALDKRVDIGGGG